MVIKEYSRIVDKLPPYWNILILFVEKRYYFSLLWEETIMELLNEFNITIDFSYSKYTVYYPSEEVYFLFVMRWS